MTPPSQILFVVFISTMLSGFTPTFCQQQPNLRIVFRTDPEQRRFVDEFIKQGAPVGQREIVGIRMEAISELNILARTKPWVIPILEQRIQTLLKEPIKNKEEIDRIAECIAGSASQDGLDSIIRLFADQPDSAKWIQWFIYGALDNPNYVNLWYRALDSPIPTVKTVAAKCMKKIAIIGHAARDRDWADAAIDRYQHAPTEEDILSDPIFGLERSRELKVGDIRHLKALGVAEMERRKNGGKAGHPRPNEPVQPYSMPIIPK